MPRLIFGSLFLSEVTSISFTGKSSYRTKLHFAGSEPDFARPVKRGGVAKGARSLFGSHFFIFHFYNWNF